MKIAEILINNSVRELGKIFHYNVPDSLLSNIKIGQVVLVPFGVYNKLIQGFVIGFTDKSDYKNLKDINHILLDEKPIEEDLIKLAYWMGKEYMCNVSACLKLMLPPLKSKKPAKKEQPKDKNPLRKKSYNTTIPFIPNEHQQKALDTIGQCIDNYKQAEFLIHGVTGSGKTEVYLQLIARVLDAGRQAIVLVPEISLTPQMIDRFVGRFKNQVAILHSRLSDGERKDQWHKIKNGEVNIVVGARSAIFAPFDRLGIIVIDEEHESTYKSEKTPKYDAREIAKKRCEFENAVLVLGSATPSIETYYKALNKQIGLVQILQRANKGSLPQVEVVDMRQELEKGNKSVFSSSLYNAITQNIKDGNQTILFLNKRGHSSFVLCRDCGYVSMCKRCNISLTYHMSNNSLRCHYCGYSIRNFVTCPSCQSKNIRQFGIGTQKLEEEVKKYFPQATVLRMDLDTTSKKNSHEQILTKFQSENINILIGTQMIAKGHDFPNVTLVGIISADMLLGFEDYKSSEKTFQILTQVAGRAGRAQKEGRVIVQTYNIDHFSITTSQKQDYITFYQNEIILRQQLAYPPFADIVTLLVTSKDSVLTKNVCEELESVLRMEFSDSIQILKSSQAPISKINNNYRWRIILKCKITEDIKEKLNMTVQNVYDKYSDKCNINIDVNPVSMM